MQTHAQPGTEGDAPHRRGAWSATAACCTRCPGRCWSRRTSGPAGLARCGPAQGLPRPCHMPAGSLQVKQRRSWGSEHLAVHAAVYAGQGPDASADLSSAEPVLARGARLQQGCWQRTALVAVQGQTAAALHAHRATRQLSLRLHLGRWHSFGSAPGQASWQAAPHPRMHVRANVIAVLHNCRARRQLSSRL